MIITSGFVKKNRCYFDPNNMRVLFYCDVQEKRFSPKGLYANTTVTPKLLCLHWDQQPQGVIMCVHEEGKRRGLCAPCT